jgi:hypothetical protein
MVRLFEMTQLIGFSPAKLLLLLVKMFNENFPFIYMQYDLPERLERKHYYPRLLYTLTKNRLYELYIVIHQTCRVGIIGTVFILFFKRQEGLKTLISWRVI